MDTPISTDAQFSCFWNTFFFQKSKFCRFRNFENLVEKLRLGISQIDFFKWILYLIWKFQLTSDFFHFSVKTFLTFSSTDSTCENQFYKWFIYPKKIFSRFQKYGVRVHFRKSILKIEYMFMRFRGEGVLSFFRMCTPAPTSTPQPASLP